MYLSPEPPEITRHFVNLGDRQVHFRLAGAGPPLLLLHQSPSSSAEMATEMIDYADNFTVISVDTPGFGQSDRLPMTKPDITDFAHALEEFVTALGLEQVLLYGFHTGAIIGFEFCRLYPDRCAAAVINGLVVMEGEELEDFLLHYNFMPPPTAAGEHMAWTWARLRDQRIFFPWYRKTSDARMAFDLPDAEFQQPYTLDYFRAGDGGRAAYQAAFAYPTRKCMPEITRPVYLLNYAQDPLARHPERLDGWPHCVHREIFAEPERLNERSKKVFLKHAPSPVSLQRTSAGQFTGAYRKDYINTNFGPVLVNFSAAGASAPILLLHDVGASSQSLDRLAADLRGQCSDQRQIISVDLPGHGDTGGLRMPDYSVGNIVGALAAVMEALGLEDTIVLSVGAGCIIATALAISETNRVRELGLIDPWLFDEAERHELAQNYAPDLAPRQSGQHFLSAWTFARDSELFWPWYDCRVVNVLRRAPEIEPAQTHARTVEALKAGAAFSEILRNTMACDFEAMLNSLAKPALIFARQGNGHEQRAEEVARNVPGTIYNRLPESRSDWAGPLLDALQSGG